MCNDEPGCKGFSYRSGTVDDTDFDEGVAVAEIWFMNDAGHFFEESDKWGTYVKCDGILPRTGGGWVGDTLAPVPAPNSST